jgi:hypothetical protein
MNDTHEPSTEDTKPDADAIASLAELDPAEAPAAAEALAAELANQLESAGGAAPETAQHQFDRSES